MGKAKLLLGRDGDWGCTSALYRATALYIEHDASGRQKDGRLRGVQKWSQIYSIM